MIAMLVRIYVFAGITYGEEEHIKTLVRENIVSRSKKFKRNKLAIRATREETYALFEFDIVRYDDYKPGLQRIKYALEKDGYNVMIELFSKRDNTVVRRL